MSLTFRVYETLRRGRAWCFTRFIRSSLGELGQQASITPPCQFVRPDRIFIGEGTVVGPNSILRVLSDEARIEIGNDVSIVGGCSISARVCVTIEPSVLFARGVYIADHSHAFETAGTAVKHQGLKDERAIVVGRGAWLGENVVIGPGVKIGEGAVVAAHSLVRTDVPPFSLAAGAPSRVIRDWAPV